MAPLTTFCTGSMRRHTTRGKLFFWVSHVGCIRTSGARAAVGAGGAADGGDGRALAAAVRTQRRPANLDAAEAPGVRGVIVFAREWRGEAGARRDSIGGGCAEGGDGEAAEEAHGATAGHRGVRRRVDAADTETGRDRKDQSQLEHFFRETSCFLAEKGRDASSRI